MDAALLADLDADMLANLIDDLSAALTADLLACAHLLTYVKGNLTSGTGRG